MEIKRLVSKSYWIARLSGWKVTDQGIVREFFQLLQPQERLQPDGRESARFDRGQTPPAPLYPENRNLVLEDLAAAKQFYAQTLGIEVTEENDMMTLQLAGGGRVLVYPKADHEPASFTVLNFPVEDIDQAVDGLAAAGVQFERYEGSGQDERGVQRQYGPPIAWFKDPAGNILSVLQT